MSLHWTLIAGFLYGEIATLLILLIPLISPRAWNKLFKSRFLKGLESQLIYYFYVLVAILVLFFLGKSVYKKVLWTHLCKPVFNPSFQMPSGKCGSTATNPPVSTLPREVISTPRCKCT